MTDHSAHGFNKLLKMISKQSSIVFSGKIFFQVLGFIISLLLARVLGATLLGRFQLGLSMVRILATLSLLGFDYGLIRFIPVYNLEGPGKTKRLLMHSFSVTLIVSLLLALALYAGGSRIATGFFHSIEMIPVLRLFAFYLPVIALFNLATATLRGLKRADLDTYVNNGFTPLAFILLIVIMVLAGGSLQMVIFAKIASTVIGLSIVGYLLYRTFPQLLHSSAQPFARPQYYRFALPLLVIVLLNLVMVEVDSLMLGYYMTSHEVGIYSIVIKLATLIVFSLQAVSTIFAPNISELYEKKDMKSLERLLKVLTKWIMYISLFTYALLAVYRSEFMQVFGQDFDAGGAALLVLGFGQAVNAGTGATGTILLMTGKQHWEVLNSCLLVSFNIVFNMWLIPQYGMGGAALATATAIAIVNLMKVAETWYEFRIHPYSLSMLNGVAGLAVITVIMYFIRQGLVQAALPYGLMLVIGIPLFAVAALALVWVVRLNEDDAILLEKLPFAHKLKIIKSEQKYEHV